MQSKNDFDYVAFLGHDGTAAVDGEALLQHFREQWSLALMDFMDPLTHFTGIVTVSVMADAEVQDAIKAFDLFSKYSSYPSGYEAKLRNALVVNSRAPSCELAFELG